MTLDMLQAIGTAVSALAVVLSMLSLAIGMRHNTQAQHSQNYAQALGRLAAMQARLSADAEMSELFSRGIRDATGLSAEERIRLTWTMYEMFGSFEFMYHQSRIKALPAAIWERWAITTSWWLSYPGIRAWWHARPTPFSREFTAFVEECIAQPIHDQGATLRWREFLDNDATKAAAQG